MKCTNKFHFTSSLFKSLISSPILLMVLLVTIVLATSCSSDRLPKDMEKSHLPVARGAANVILVVMDTAIWDEAIGDKLREIYAGSVPGLPQDEAYFKIRNINPLKLNRILKSSKNLLFVSTLDNHSLQSRSMHEYFTKGSLEKIMKDTSRFKLAQKNLFARGQEVLHLFGQTEKQLLAHLEANKVQLKSYFMAIEAKRLSAKLFKKREKIIEKQIREKHQFMVKIPFGYDLAQNKDNFVWIRQLDSEFDKNVFVYYAPFESQEPFANVVEYRESITTKQMRDIQKPEIFMTIQAGYEEVKEVNFKGMYAKEIRGLWKLSDISGGGPFISYTFVDESQKRIYYLEGYVYAPSKDKREFMQEMEVIVQSFASGEMLNKK